MFEPFFTTKEVGKGSGLGLAQVYAFMKQSQGEVAIESVEGRGTTVTLAFPRSHLPVPIAAAEHQPKVPLTIRHHAGSVLLVEDDQSVAGLTIALLDSIGYDVEHVTSGPAALATLANDKCFDVVFSDSMMAGGMSGADLARAIRAVQPALPVVLATGYIDSAREIIAEGSEVLQKPYQLEELATALATARGLEPSQSNANFIERGAAFDCQSGNGC